MADGVIIDNRLINRWREIQSSYRFAQQARGKRTGL